MQSLVNMFTGGQKTEAPKEASDALDFKAALTNGSSVLRSNGEQTVGGEETTVEQTLQPSLKLLMFYFSMHNCPPCREFTPLLAELYKDMNDTEQVMEVIFFSGDPTQEVYNEYFGEMPWKALPFKDGRLKAIAKNFKVKGLPRLIVLDAQTMKVLHDDAVATITEKGPVILEEWMSQGN